MKRLILLLALAASAGCTENTRSRYLGGEGKLLMPPGRKVVQVTWKEAQLWILTREARPGEDPEAYVFSEKSSYGFFEGKIHIVEVK